MYHSTPSSRATKKRKTESSGGVHTQVVESQNMVRDMRGLETIMEMMVSMLLESQLPHKTVNLLFYW